MIGPFWPWGSGNMAPYTDFHALNTDWLIKIAKDFLDQYTTIQDTITQGKQDLDDKTAAGLEALQAEADRLQGLLDAWYTEHSEDIANELATAVASAIATFNEAATTKAAEVIASIPATSPGLMIVFVRYQNKKVLAFRPGHCTWTTIYQASSS